MKKRIGIGSVISFLIIFCGYVNAADIPKVKSAIIIDHNPEINLSMWSWCCQQNHNSRETVQKYLEAL